LQLKDGFFAHDAKIGLFVVFESGVVADKAGVMVDG
jgi:hypothetical protein